MLLFTKGYNFYCLCFAYSPVHTYSTLTRVGWALVVRKNSILVLLTLILVLAGRGMDGVTRNSGCVFCTNDGNGSKNEDHEEASPNLKPEKLYGYFGAKYTQADGGKELFATADVFQHKLVIDAKVYRHHGRSHKHYVRIMWTKNVI